MNNCLTELFGIDFPIIQGGMMGVGRAQLASAVSNSGALGIITALTQPTPQALLDEIEACRALTNKPFGVNLTFLPSRSPPPYDQYIQAIVQSGIKIVETAGNNPKDVVDIFKQAGISIIHKCTAVRHALSAERSGVDAVSIDGFEAAGHPGEDDIGGLVIIPAAAARLNIPIVASGGFADGRGMAAALALGADGVNMGTRFMITQESPVHDAIKQAIAAATERDTCVIFKPFRNTARVFRNHISEEVLDIQQRFGSSFEDVAELVSGTRGRAALESGEINSGLVWAGQSVGLINDVPTCAELVERIVRECRESLAKAAAVAG